MKEFDQVYATSANYSWTNADSFKSFVLLLTYHVKKLIHINILSKDYVTEPFDERVHI